jgi:predicted peroxiredoxin
MAVMSDRIRAAAGIPGRASFLRVARSLQTDAAQEELMDTRNLVVVVTHGIDHELSSVALTIANGGITAGLKVSLFLTSAGVDIARKRAADTTHVHPLEPLAALLKDFLARGGTLWACTPCVKARGYAQEDLIEGTVITGASLMHGLIKEGAATLSF